MNALLAPGARVRCHLGLSTIYGSLRHVGPGTTYVTVLVDGDARDVRLHKDAWTVEVFDFDNMGWLEIEWRRHVHAGLVPRVGAIR